MAMWSPTISSPSSDRAVQRVDKCAIPGVRVLCAVALAFGVPTGTLAAPPLIMTCHELIQGAPDPDGSRYVLDGDTLFRETPGAPESRTFLSTSTLKRLTLFNNHTHSSSWATHRVVGHKVHRTVYWKTRSGVDVRTLRQVFDFDAQTLLDGPPPGSDSCHHTGR